MRDHPLSLLRSYAQAAEVHAAKEHGYLCSASGTAATRLTVPTIDRIMACEQSKHSGYDQKDNSGNHVGSFNPVIEELSLCYGAWFGFQVIENFPGAQWVGLHEPLPPRILFQSLTYSPIDAVRRLLTSRGAAPLAVLWQQLQESQSSKPDAESTESINRKAWDHLVHDYRFFADDELPSDPVAVRLALDPWLLSEGDLTGKRILCLAAGGGKHGPLYALAGANVTVLDFSQPHLDRDRELAKLLDLPIATVCRSLSNLEAWQTDPFDIVVQPVSLCYVVDCQRIYQAVAARLRRGGLYILQNKQPASLQASESEAAPYALSYPYANGFALPMLRQASVTREPGMIEYIHSFDALIGGLCRAGFYIEDFNEPRYGDAWSAPSSPNYRHLYLPPYFKIKARRR